jgi:hypothetical protein
MNASPPDPEPDPPAKYDPAILKPIQSAIAAGLEERTRLEAERLEREALIRKIDFVYELLGLVANGLPHRPVQDHGEIVVAPRIWAQDIQRLTRVWISCPWLYEADARVIPRIVTPEGNRALGFDAAYNVFELACRGADLDDLERCIADQLEQLRLLRDKSMRREDEDSPEGMAHYFRKLHFWFFKTGGDIWKHGIKELRISIRVPAPGSHVAHVPRVLGQAPPDAAPVAPAIVGPKDGPMEQAVPARPRQRRGAPKRYDADADRRIWDAWTTSTFARYEDLARELGDITAEEVAGAVDRHRKRQEDQQRAKRSGSA